MKHVFLICITALLFTSCQKDFLIDADAVISPTTIVASTQLNISYGTDPLQKMDLYLPSGRSAATKVMIMMEYR
jgi:hypothetical protein